MAGLRFELGRLDPGPRHQVLAWVYSTVWTSLMPLFTFARTIRGLPLSNDSSLDALVRWRPFPVCAGYPRRRRRISSGVASITISGESFDCHSVTISVRRARLIVACRLHPRAFNGETPGYPERR